MIAAQPEHASLLRPTPLDGTQVVEVGRGVGASYCARLFAQLGATVHTFRDPVDPHEEDLRRRAQRLYLDRSKTVVAEWNDADLLEAVHGAHVVVHGNDPYDGDAYAIRLDYDRFRAIQPALVFVALTPFGVDGPNATWRGTDINAQSMSGWASIVGNPGEAPLAMNYDVGALQQGLSAAGAAVAALLARGSHGVGEFIDIAEADVIAASIRMYSLVYRFLDIPLRRSGYRAPGSSGRYPHTMLPCKDGYVITICRSQTDWDRLIEMVGQPAWAGEDRYRDFFAMGTRYPAEVDALLAPWLECHTKAEIADLAARHRVPMAPVRTVEEVLGDPQLRHRSFFDTVTAPDGSTAHLPGLMAHWNTYAGDVNTKGEQ